MAIIILLFVKDVPRGNAEPEFENTEQVGDYHFEWSKIKNIVTKKKPDNDGFTWVFRSLSIEHRCCLHIHFFWLKKEATMLSQRY